MGDPQGNKILSLGQHEMLNVHTRLAPSGSTASVISTEVEKTDASHLNHNHLDGRTHAKHLRFNNKGFKDLGGIGSTALETNSSQESSSEDDMGSVELTRSALEDKNTKGILRKSGSSCSSTRVAAVSTKTKVSELSGNPTSTVNCSHQLMTSSSEIMHSNTNCGDNADILQLRRASFEKIVPPTDNVDTSITRTNTATLASVTSDFVVVTLADLKGSTVSHTNNAKNSLRESTDPTSVTTTPSNSALHHHSHHPISA